MGYVTNHSIGMTKQILDADVEQIETFLAHQLPDFVSTIVMLLAMFIIMFSQNFWLALACLIPILVGFVCQFAMMIKILKIGPGAATPTLKLRSFSESMNMITEGVKRVDEILNEKPLPEPAHKGSPSGPKGGLGRSKFPSGYDCSSFSSTRTSVMSLASRYIAFRPLIK